jgi:hypothetical protein
MLRGNVPLEQEHVSVSAVIKRQSLIDRKKLSLGHALACRAAAKPAGKCGILLRECGAVREQKKHQYGNCA